MFEKNFYYIKCSYISKKVFRNTHAYEGCLIRHKNYNYNYYNYI